MGNNTIRRRLAAAVASLALVVVLGSTVAQAVSDSGPTRGDAEAVFQAFFTGGFAIRAHNPLANGAPGVPLDPPPDSVRIYPLADDIEYCQQGWHVVLLGVWDDPTLYPGGKKELIDYLSALDTQFVLDGVPLYTERTEIKRFTHPFPEFSENPLIGPNFGAFLPPGSLSLGTHELRTIQHAPDFDDEFTISFTVVSC
jgi:hypothetical protein